MKISKIAKKIEKVQSEKRYEHTLGVSYTAGCLAMRYKEDVEKARLAGLLHDCAKHLDEERLLELCDKYKIEVSSVERDNPFLLHGKVGALIAKKKFDIEDDTILDAIAYHVTGKPQMSLLGKIIFVADYIEPNRDFADNLPMLRELAFDDLDLCLIKILECTLNHLNNKKSVIDPTTQKTYDYYMKECLNNG